jgi:gliding motility-associated-like protein
MTISGLVPGYFDTVRFSYNGVPQAPIVLPVSAAGTVTLTNLCAGNYTGITVKMNSCIANGTDVTLVDPVFAVSTITFVNPTVCGICDGSITLTGLVPGHYDTVNFIKDGVPQTPIVFFITATGNITLTNLCAGNYTGITVKMNTCTTAALTATLTNPSFTISSTSNTNPSVCGACDATITINGLIPGYYDTVRFIKDGVPQTPVVLLVPASGTIVLTGLCAGVYTNINVKMNSCITPSVGPITLVNPSFGISDTSSTNASCSACDGTFTVYGLTPNQTVTINYSFNGVPQPPYTTTSSASGTVTKTGLCPGSYSNITATLNTCVSNPVGTVVISAPPLIPISINSVTQPTECGICNGKIVIYGAPPGPIDTIFYSLNGVPQTPLLYSASPDSLITLYNMCAGSYTNFFIKVGPCPTTTITTPTVLSAPALVAGFTSMFTLGCNFDVATFNNSSYNPGGSLWYMWDFGDGVTDTARNPTHVYTSQGTFHIVLTITNHYCTQTHDTTVILNHNVSASFTSDTLVCQNRPVAFTSTSTGTPGPLSYAWDFGDGTVSTATNPTHTFANAGTYTVRLITGNTIPCFDTAYSSIFVDTASGLSISLSDTVLCRSTYVTMTSNFTHVGYTGITWDFGDGDSAKNVNPVVYAYHNTGTFVLTSTVGFRICPALTTSRIVTVVPQPVINLGGDTIICPGSETLELADFINAGNTAASWLWNTGQTSYNIYVSTPGGYQATVTIGNCSATDSVTIGEDCYMNMPNIFTPNGDGINDYFYPRQYLTSGLTKFKMDIYNRWGQLIFTTNSVDGRGWDGLYNGEQQPQGVFIYVIDATFRDGKKEHHQGNVTLIR